MTTYLLTYDESGGLQVHKTIGQGTQLEPPKGTVSIPELLKGLGRPETDEEVEKQVIKKLNENNVTIISPPIRATYDSPFTLPINRRNEAMFKVQIN